MKRNGAQAGQGTLESRFAALTSGLLARKGHAAPSNSPLHDPAEETDPFALEPKSAAGKRQPPPVTAEDLKEKPQPEQVAAPAAAETPRSKPAESRKPLQARAAGEPAAAAPPPKTVSSPPHAAPMKVINERSLEAGYPDNPSLEEIAALDAEADEVVSYFEKFGNEQTVAREKDRFYANESAADRGDFDDEKADPPQRQPAASPALSGASPVKAGVTVELSAREFMRLSLGAAELELSAQDLMAEAIEEYLDARGVMSLGGCACLAQVSPKAGRTDHEES